MLLGLPPQGAVAVPADKGLSRGRLAELAARGTATRYGSAAAQANIGMPVGGAGAGQVHLSGDGRTWLWEVFNPDGFPYGGADWQGVHYAHPPAPAAPLRTGFALRWSGGTRSLDGDGFRDVVFTGQYPVGTVEFADPAVPVAVRLDAYSPFVPTAADDSSLPATVFEYTLRNTSDRTTDVQVLGFAENPVCVRSRTTQPVLLGAERFGAGGGTGIQYTARAGDPDPSPRQEIVFEEWERSDYTGWTASGTAFGAGPVTEAECPDYFRREGPLGTTGTRFVTSHNFRAGDGGDPDGHLGRLTSRPFTVERRYVAAAVGGGAQAGRACVNVLVDGEVVASFTGRNAETLVERAADVGAYEGRRATIEIVDEATGGWGHINCDRIRFTDTPLDPQPLDRLTDHGTFALTAFHPAATARPSLDRWATPADWFDAADGPAEADAVARGLAGAVTVRVRLAPGASETVRFALCWHFDLVDPNLFKRLDGAATLRRHYGTRFADARAVAALLAVRGGELAAATHDFVRTWYTDSTLPHWFLERTLAPASTLATSTVHRFAGGRFYAFEGLYCCDGTCTHVWNYAQSVARLFPELERDTRERVDFGLAFHPDTGAVDYRGEYGRTVAHDGQCGNILRACREHQMAPDDTFLARVWPNVKKAAEYLIGADGQDAAGADGILQGRQYNTLDSAWYGEIPWISGLYVAALHAAAQMADDMADDAFAARCRVLAAEGTARLGGLWNERYGYFEQHLDPAHADAVNSGRGCHLDQMFGQTYAFQLGLPRVFPAGRARTALANMFRNNFLPDAQAYKDESGIEGGRVYSTAGEAGTLLCTWPFGGSDTAPGSGDPAVIGYFNEVWTGVEYQFAAQLMAEGMVDEALAVTRAVHDRYTADRRNPYNEVECSDHYARAMMSHAVYLAATGYEYHGPRGHLGFAPRLSPDDFAAAFTAAEGWGLYRQTRTGRSVRSEIEVRYGRLRLASFAAAPPDGGGTGEDGARNPGASVRRITRAGRPVALAAHRTALSGGRALVTLARKVTLERGDRLVVTFR
ncbi:hypothetical protein GCM10018793_23060 [Streptomyces sulfonofaciens]|uniref:Beta-glucocerebrosidase 2-like protein n=1 Tax=Streptomyces sulfonofaciens TaxID=68272 RepID=A0A919KYW4_9ACTN|nr:hypothetical protein GCM10018793_23060 [Streptomyces sulfonofaciens]